MGLAEDRLVVRDSRGRGVMKTVQMENVENRVSLHGALYGAHCSWCSRKHV